MPTPRSLSRAAAAFLLFLTCQSPLAFGADVWELDTVETYGPDGKITIGGNTDRKLRFEDPEIKIVSDAGTKSGKALLFGGTQAKPVTSTRIYEGDLSAEVRLKINPAADGGEDVQTVLYRPGAYELRYHAKQQELEALIIYKEKTPPVSVRVPLSADHWSDVDLLVKGSDITLKADTAALTGKLPDGSTLFAARSYLRIGRMDQSRPFKGSLADIVVSEPAE